MRKCKVSDKTKIPVKRPDTGAWIKHGSQAKPKVSEKSHKDALLHLPIRFGAFHPTKEAVKAAQDLFKALARQFPATIAGFHPSNEQVAFLNRSFAGADEWLDWVDPTARHTIEIDKRPAICALLLLTKNYFENLEVVRRPSDAPLLNQIKKVQNAAKALQSKLKQLPVHVRMASNTFDFLEHHSGNLLGYTALIEGLEKSLSRLVATFDDLSNSTTVGARQKDHIRNAVEILVDAWRKSHQGNFSFRYDRAKDGNKSVYVSEGVEFVSSAMRIIDPELELGAIVSALKAVAPRRAPASKNVAKIRTISGTRNNGPGRHR